MDDGEFPAPLERKKPAHPRARGGRCWLRGLGCRAEARVHFLADDLSNLLFAQARWGF